MMDKESMLSLLKKMKVLFCAVLMRCPSRKVKLWAETGAIFQRSRPVTFRDLDFEDNPALISLRQALRAGILKEIDVMDCQNVRLHGWFLPPEKHMPTVIYSYGNTANLSEGKYLMEAFGRRGFGFLAWSYPGYELSEGHPSEQGLYDGVQAMSDYLVSDYGIQPSDQIAMGHSLGGLVSIDAATHIPFGLIALMATPPCIPDYYGHLLTKIPSWLRWLCVSKEEINQRFDAASKMPLVKSPVIFIYGENDDELPLEMARELFALTKVPCREHWIRGAGHDLEILPQFAEKICEEICSFQSCADKVLIS